MKSLLKYTWVLIVAAIGLGLAACAKGNTAVNSSACPAGTTYDGTNCLNYIVQGNPADIPAGTQVGFFSQSSNMPYYSPTNQYGTATMNLGQGMSTLLQYDMGVCNRNDLSGGTAACSTWVAGIHDISILMDGSAATSATLVVRSYINQNPFGSYYYSLPNFKNFILGMFGISSANTSGVFDPLILKMTVWPINNNAGFELRSASGGGPTNSYGWWRALQFQVMNGKATDTSFNYNFYIDGGNQQMQTIMSGKMVRCETNNCRLSNY